jgi:hypothetical protein
MTLEVRPEGPANESRTCAQVTSAAPGAQTGYGAEPHRK